MRHAFPKKSHPHHHDDERFSVGAFCGVAALIAAACAGIVLALAGWIGGAAGEYVSDHPAVVYLLAFLAGIVGSSAWFENRQSN